LPDGPGVTHWTGFAPEVLPSMSDDNSKLRNAGFTLTSADYTAALRLNMRSYYRRPLPLLVLAAFAALALFILVVRPGEDATLGSIALGAAIGVLILPLVVYLLFVPLRARKIFAQQKTLHEPVSIAWSETAYTASTPTVTGTVPWSNYFDWLEDDRMIVIRQSMTLFQMLPKTALTAEQAADIRACARAGGLKGA